MNFFKMALIFLLLTVFSPAFSQQIAKGSFDVYQRSRRDMATVLGMGAAGGIIGLSTLSFREEPGKHLSSITVGGALGIIAGVVFILYTSYNETATVYGDEVTMDDPRDEGHSRFVNFPMSVASWSWHF